MAGIIDGLLGAGVGAAGAVVNNAMFNRQQQAEQDKENRATDREAFLMELRSKYAKDQAQFANDLQLGLMDKQAQITKDNAKYNNDLALADYQAKSGIDDRLAAAREKRANSEWEHRNGIEFDQQKTLRSIPSGGKDTQAEFVREIQQQYAKADDAGKAKLIKDYPLVFGQKNGGAGYSLESVADGPLRADGKQASKPVLFNKQTGAVMPVVSADTRLAGFFQGIASTSKDKAQQMIADAKSKGWSEGQIRLALQAAGLN